MTSEEGLKYYTQMTRIRRLEIATNALYKERFVRGFCHLYSGQEAIAAGFESQLRDTDAVITGYRDHGWALITGSSMAEIITELTGRKSGASRGKGLSLVVKFFSFIFSSILFIYLFIYILLSSIRRFNAHVQ